jgi:pyruvate dehydrogenase E2 component (dihydrolipoamide acetyltransferase)
MPIEILMPALSPTMTEGKLAKWHVSVGDVVESGDVIAEIETDKATMEVEAVDEGKVGKIIIEEGSDAVAVNETIAILLEEDEDEAALSEISVKNTTAAKSNGEDKQTIEKRNQIQEVMPSSAVENSVSENRVFASPLARRMAVQMGFNLQLKKI